MDVGSLNIHGSLNQTSTDGARVAQGTSLQRPSNAAGLIRFNTDLSRFETNNGSAWSNISSADGTVTSVALTGVANAITVTGSPITGSGTLALALIGELAGLNALASNGSVTRTANGTYTVRSTAVSTAAGSQGLTVSNGDGVSGNPTLGLTITGLSAANSIANTNTFILNDGTNNLKGTIAQLTTYLDTKFVSQAGDTMTGLLVLSGDPTSALDATTKSYVDNSITTAISAAPYTSVYRRSFTNASLVASTLTVTHSLGEQFVHVVVTDNGNKLIQPDEITMTSNTVATIDLTSYGTLTGTWNVTVIG